MKNTLPGEPRKRPPRRKKRGRPRRRDNPVRVHVRLPGALHEWVRRRATTFERSYSDVIAAAVRYYYEKTDDDAVLSGLLARDLADVTRLRVVKPERGAKPPRR